MQIIKTLVLSALLGLTVFNTACEVENEGVKIWVENYAYGGEPGDANYGSVGRVDFYFFNAVVAVVDSGDKWSTRKDITGEPLWASAVLHRWDGALVNYGPFEIDGFHDKYIIKVTDERAWMEKVHDD